MNTTSKLRKKAKKPTLVIDDTLKNRSISSPLFEKKNEKAIQIMKQVRSKQSAQQTKE